MQPQPNPGSEASYHSHHAPLGAFATFSFGLVGAQGGFGHGLRGPARQNLYIGFRRGSGPFELLPFFRSPQSGVVAFTGEGNSDADQSRAAEAATVSLPSNIRSLGPEEFERTLGWASDTWQADERRFGLRVLTPFGPTPDPRRCSLETARLHFSPHVNASIEYDNTKGSEPVQLIFGVGDDDHVFRPLQDTDATLQGFALGTRFAYATPAQRRVEARQGFNVFEPQFRDYHGLLLVGGETALVFSVEPGKCQRFPLVLAFYHDGQASTGLDTRYAYTRWFKALEDVTRHGLTNQKQYTALAAERDAELLNSKLSADQQFLLAHATHSYLGNTQLLWGEAGPVWVVNEGEYRMINTFDLTVDHLFFELRWFPWAVRNTLEWFSERYSYRDQIRVGTRRVKGGISFCHDMGVDNSFTPATRSSYECEDLTGCFSHMTIEQLLNWILCATTYALHTQDKKWLKRQQATLRDCVESLRRRDNPEAKLRDGIPKHDSLRCGSGSEITTYDSLDTSLGQARNNLYLSVKTLGAWLNLEAAFRLLSLKSEAKSAKNEAERLSQTLATKFDTEAQMFPAVFEGANTSRIIPAVEGLVYPLFLKQTQALASDGPLAPLLSLLEKHLSAILQPGICLDAASGAWKMSSTSNNTWLSKIALSQHVVRQLFPSALSDVARAADAVHASWQRGPSCGAHAFCDQIQSDTGVTCGSRYYPRGVTAVLWLDE